MHIKIYKDISHAIHTVLASAKNPLLTLRNFTCLTFHPVATFNTNDITACIIHIYSFRTTASNKSMMKNDIE